MLFGSDKWISFFKDAEFVRFGAYGNPSCLPLAMIADIANRSIRSTGYFHDWHKMPVSLAKAYGKYLMASCNKTNKTFAENLGLRTFTVIPDTEKTLNGAIECLADSKGLTCRECGLCDGTKRSSTRGKALPSVFIRAHGYQTKKASEMMTASAN